MCDTVPVVIVTTNNEVFIVVSLLLHSSSIGFIVMMYGVILSVRECKKE